MTQITAYLAGPDVFLPDAPAHAQRKVAICARYGITGRPPLTEDSASLPALPGEAAWQAIFRKILAMMEACDILIANLTPLPRRLGRCRHAGRARLVPGPRPADLRLLEHRAALCRAQSGPSRGAA